MGRTNTGEKDGKKKMTQWIFAILITGGIGATIINFLLPKFWPTNLPPEAKIITSSTKGFVSDTIVFDSTSSLDPEGQELFYTWRINEEQVSEDYVLKYVFKNPGQYCIMLSVKDSKGLSNNASVIIDIKPFHANSLAEALKNYKYEFGWSGDLVGTVDTRISYYPIIEITLKNDNFVTMKYQYRNGILAMTISEKLLIGRWSDGDTEDLSDNKWGELELTFDENFARAVGWWNYGGQRQKYNAFMRRIE